MSMTVIELRDILSNLVEKEFDDTLIRFTPGNKAEAGHPGINICGYYLSECEENDWELRLCEDFTNREAFDKDQILKDKLSDCIDDIKALVDRL